MIICFPCIYVFCCLFWIIFFTHIDTTFLRRWAVLQSAISCILYWLGLSDILSTCWSVPFLIIPWASTFTGGSFKVPHLSFYFLRVFLTSVCWWVFIGVWVTASLLRSLGFFSVFWPVSAMFSICPPISISYTPLFKPLWTVPSAPAAIGITVTSCSPTFLVLWQGPSIYLSAFFDFNSVVRWDGKVHYTTSSLFFLLIIIWSCLLAEIR